MRRERLEIQPDPRVVPLGLRTMDDVFALEGELVNRDSRSEVMRLRCSGGALYLKRFSYRGTAARLGRLFLATHCRNEYRNFLRLRALGIGCPEAVAWGEERLLGLPLRAFLITAEIPAARTLESRLQAETMSPDEKLLLIATLADQVAIMHDAGYLDRDLKFRNILVDEEGAVFHVDSPQGHSKGRPLTEGEALRDLGTLMKHAARYFSARQCLRFLAVYADGRRIDHAARRRLAVQVLERSRELHRRTGTEPAVLRQSAGA